MTTESERARAFDELRALQDEMDRYEIVVGEATLFVGQFGVEVAGENFGAFYKGLSRKLGTTTNYRDALGDVLILVERLVDIRNGDNTHLLEYPMGSPEYGACRTLAIDDHEERIRKCLRYIK